MLPQTHRFSPYCLLFTAITLSSWAAAATPDANEPRDAVPPSVPSPLFVAQAGGVVGPSLGANLAIDARLAGGLYMGLQAGFFTDHRNGYPFVGPRASYRIPLTDWLRVVPTFGVSHVSVLAQDEDPYHIVYQSPVSPTGGVEVAAQIGHFVTGIDAQVMPVHTKKSLASQSETIDETLFLLPISLFAGATF